MDEKWFTTDTFSFFFFIYLYIIINNKLINIIMKIYD